MKAKRFTSPATVSRRRFLFQALAGAAGIRAVALADDKPTAPSLPRDGFLPDELRAMEATAAAFMKKHGVPGLSVAIAMKGRLVYADGYGLADKGRGEKVTPNHLFRIASVTKPITSATLFSLIETGKLRLSDKVFGPGAVLGTAYGEPPYQPHIAELTIEHLLTHTAGGWQNDGRDPMFSHPGMDHRQLITWTISHQPLTHPPRQHYAYSNFGYCVLGRVIEKLTAKTYEEAVQERILTPCGISRMRIGGNTLAERAEREVIYYDQDGEDP
jgi:CubicO group peptidase (beta-lactamase class C family)